MRLLGAGDPLLVARDREHLIEDTAIRKRLWRPVGSPGLILHDGRPAGLWRARKQGSRLALETEWFGEPADVREEGSGSPPYAAPSSPTRRSAARPRTERTRPVLILGGSAARRSASRRVIASAGSGRETW